MTTVQTTAAPTCGQCKKRQCMRDKAKPSGFRAKCCTCSRTPAGRKVAGQWYKKQKPRLYRDIKHSKWVQKLRREYGLSESEYDGLVKAAGGKCSICREPERIKVNGQTARLCVDHCHVTGVARGVLCRRCNVMIAHADRNPNIFILAMKYLGFEHSVTLDTGA